MNLEYNEVSHLPFTEEVFRRESPGFIRYRIKGSKYGFDYGMIHKRFSPIFHFRRNGFQFKGRKGPVSFQDVLDSVPSEHIAFLILCKDVFDYD